MIPRSTQRRLAAVAGSIDSSSADLDAAAGQLTSASGTISRNASNEAAAIEEISASLRELSAVAQSSRTHATKTHTDATNARASVDAGLKAVTELGTAMDSVTAERQVLDDRIRARPELRRFGTLFVWQGKLSDIGWSITRVILTGAGTSFGRENWATMGGTHGIIFTGRRWRVHFWRNASAPFQ